jgi:hypothetical protein
MSNDRYIDKMMKNIRHAILFLFGCSFISFAVFASELGLDPNPGWGRSRILVFFLGMLLLASFVDSRFGSARIENVLGRIDTWFTDVREKIFDRLQIPMLIRHGVSQRIRGRFIYVFVTFAFFAVISIYIWFASAGTWADWPKASNYYNLLANAFAHGQVSLDLEVSPKLLALPDPYDFASRNGIEYLWDAILHEGKYYLYWGPMPAIIVASIKLIRPLDVGDPIIVFGAAAGLALFQTLLLTRIWMRSFQRLPSWTLLLGIILADLVIPLTWMIHRSNVYEAAILSAQVFLAGGLYFAYLALETTKISSSWLAWASVFWVFAIASRTIVMLVVVFLLFLVFVIILYQHCLTWTPRLNTLILALGLPMVIGAIGMGWYNAVRFGSVFDFGLDYMLTSHNNHEHRDSFFSGQYLAANTYNYLLNPPERIQPFPYFRARVGKETEVFGSAIPESYYAEKVTGLTYVLPFAVFAFVPALQMAVKKIRHRQVVHDSEQPLNWIILALSGATLIAIAYLLVYYYGTMRYLADVTPMLVVLAVIGFWIGYQTVESDRFVRFVYASVGIFLAGVSIVIPNMLALLSAQKINVYSPQVLPALDALFKSIFSG